MTRNASRPLSSPASPRVQRDGNMKNKRHICTALRFCAHLGLSSEIWFKGVTSLAGYKCKTVSCDHPWPRVAMTKQSWDSDSPSGLSAPQMPAQLGDCVT